MSQIERLDAEVERLQAVARQASLAGASAAEMDAHTAAILEAVADYRRALGTA